MNSFIEHLFNDSSDYYLIQMESISNSTDTYEGETYLVSFQLPRELWGKKLDNITVGEYKKLEYSDINSNICLSSLEYPPFQLGQKISSIYRVMPIKNVGVWELIDKVRSGEIKNNYNDICSWIYRQKDDK